MTSLSRNVRPLHYKTVLFAYSHEGSVDLLWYGCSLWVVTL